MAIKSTTLVFGTTPIQPFTKEQVGFEPGNVFMSVENQNVRYWYSGDAPNTTSGHLLVAGQWISFSKPAEVQNLRMCSIAGTSTVHATIEGK